MLRSQASLPLILTESDTLDPSITLALTLSLILFDPYPHRAAAILTLILALQPTLIKARYPNPNSEREAIYLSRRA